VSEDPFESVIGQERAVRLLARLAASEAAPHALLLCGPDGTGRAAAALAFIKALYLRTVGERSVRRIESMSHPDVSLMFPLTRAGRQTEPETLRKIVRDPYGTPRPENAALHAIEQVRDLKHRFSRSAYEGAWRSAVILHAEKMREEAASALLKVLEEPPTRSVIVLTTSAPDALLPTIVSRCQMVRFPHLSEASISTALQKQVELEASRLAFIARACNGSYRQAWEMAQDDSDDMYERAFRFLDALLWGEPSLTYAAIEGLTSDKERTLSMLSAAALWLRDVMLSQAGILSVTGEQAQRLEKLSAVFDAERIREALADIERLREMNRRNVNLHAGVVTFWNRLRSYAQGVAA